MNPRRMLVGWLVALLAGTYTCIAGSAVFSGAFSGEATQSALYYGPGQYTSFDGQPMTGTFKLDTSNLVFQHGNSTSAHFGILSPLLLTFEAAGRQLVYHEYAGMYAPTLILEQAADVQRVTFSFALHRGSVDFSLAAAPDTLFTDLDPTTLQPGLVDLAHSVAGFDVVSPGIGTELRARMILHDVSFASPVPEPGTLMLVSGALIGLAVFCRPRKQSRG